MKKMESVLRKHWWKHSSEYVRISIWWNWIFRWRNRMLSMNLSLHMRRNWFKSHISRKKKRYHQMHLCFIVFIQSKTRLKICKSCFYWMNMNVSFISIFYLTDLIWCNIHLLNVLNFEYCSNWSIFNGDFIIVIISDVVMNFQMIQMVKIHSMISSCLSVFVLIEIFRKKIQFNWMLKLPFKAMIW